MFFLFVAGLLILIVPILPAKSFYQFTSSSHQVYLNQTGIINLPHTWQLKSTTGLSFRTCSNGRLLHQVGANGNSLILSLNQGVLQVQWTLNSTWSPIKAGQNFTNKVWYYVSLEFSLGTLQLKVRKGSQLVLDKIIANSTYNSDLWSIQLDGGTPLQVGIDFTGCMMPGPNVDFTNANFTAGVIFGNCSLLDQQNCADGKFIQVYLYMASTTHLLWLKNYVKSDKLSKFLFSTIPDPFYHFTIIVLSTFFLLSLIDFLRLHFS